MSDQNLEAPAQKVDRSRRNLKIAVGALGALLVVLLGVLAWQTYFGPQRAAQSALDGAFADRGELTALNDSLATYEGQKIETANTDQKGLAIDGELTTPPAFIFTNGKENADRKVLDFYFDFSDQRSRDALIANSITLRALVESGRVELRLHPLFGGRAFSMYAAESVSEVFAAEPSLAWNSMMALLRNAPVLSSVDDNDELVGSIVKELNNVGAGSVTEDSIKNGTFATWLLSIGNDPKLNSATAPKLPYIMVGDRPLNLSVDQLNDSDSFRRALTKEISR